MIQRDDLVAAATVGLLQYRQIDPLLIFLLQRDVQARRAALFEQPQAAQGNGVHLLLACLAGTLAIVTAALFAAHAVQSPGIGVLIIFISLYATSALGLASWFKRRGVAVPMRILATVAMALAPLVPLAVLALQQAVR